MSIDIRQRRPDSHPRHPALFLLLLALSLAGCGGDGSASDEHDGASDAASDALTDTGGDDVEQDTSAPPDADDSSGTGDAVDAGETSDAAGELDTTPDELPPQPWELLGAGHYGVGYRTLTVVYQPEGEAAAREIPLAVWYPTRATVGPRATYFGFIGRSEVFLNAEPASVPASADGFPLMMFSHGSGGSPEQSWFWTEYLASHGWVVAAPGHVGNMFTDGSGIPGRMFRLRPLDVSASLDLLLGGAGADPIGAVVSHETIAVSGHSFGGYTSLALSGTVYAVDAALAACGAGQLPADWCVELGAHEAMYRAGFGDPRIDAAVPMAPGLTALFGADGASAIAVPVLLMTGTRDATTPDASEGDPTWAALDGASDLRLRFENGAHFTFSNACELAAGLGASDGCGPDFTPPAEAHVAIDAYGLAWLRRELGLAVDAGDASLLSGAEPLRADVEVVLP